MKRAIIYITLLCLCSNMQAQHKVLNLQQCLNMAYEKNYKILAANKSIERAKKLQATAWDIDKTDLTLSQDPTSGGSTDNSISLTQSIEFPTLYIAKNKQLKAETQAEKSKKNVVLSELIYQIKSNYYQLIYEYERLNILNKQDSILNRYRTIAEARFKAGETRQLELLSANRMHRENKLEMTNVLSGIESKQLLLSGLVNSNEPIKPADQNLVALDWVQNSFNYQLTPEGQYAQDRITVADKAVSVAKNGYAPSLSLSLRNQMVISSWDPYHVNRNRFEGGNFMGFEVGVGIPLFYGATKARIKAAKKDKEIAEYEIKQEQLDKQQEYHACLSKCNEAFVRMKYYQEEGKQNNLKLEEMSQEEYENGEISYIEYVEALNNSIDFYMKKAAAINDYNQSVIELQKLMGNQISSEGKK